MCPQISRLSKSGSFTKKVFSIAFLLLIGLASQNFYSQKTENEQNPITLALDKPIEGEFSSAQRAQSYQIKLSAGQFASVVIEQNGIDLLVRLFGKDGNLIVDFDDEQRPREKEKIEFVAERDDVFRLDVRLVSINASGIYKIRLAEIRGATEQERLLNETRLLGTQFRILEHVGKYDEAYPLAARALEIGEKILGAENAYVGYLLNQFGYIQRRKGEYAKAEATLQRALAVNEKALGAEHPQTVDSMNRLGVVYRYKGDYAKAENFLRQATEITEKTLGAENPRMVKYLTDLSNLYSDKGDAVLDERLLTRALAIGEKVLEADDLAIGAIFNNLGFHYLEKKDFERARSFFEKSLAIYEKQLGTEVPQYSNTLQNLGIIAREKKDYARALELYNRALEIREKLLGAEHPNIAPLLNNISNVYRSKGDYAKALEIQQRVLSIAEKTLGQFHGMTLQSLAGISRIYAAQGDIDKAVKFQVRADETLEKILALDLAVGSERQKLAYFESLAERTDRTVSLSANLAPNDKTAANLAALVLLQRKGRVLDAMSESLTSLRQRFDAEDQKLLDDLNLTTAQFAKLALNKPPKMSPDEYREQFKELKEKKEKLESEISRRSAEFRAQSQPVTLDGVQREIPADAALIEFAVYRPFNPKAETSDETYGKPRYIAYVFRREGEVKWKELGDAQTINAATGELRKALRDPKRKDVGQFARAVDEKIMQPVRTLLGNVTHLLVSPDGELDLIPFEALMDEKNRYLIERFSFTYLTSGRDLLGMKAARESKNKPLIIANPLFGEPAEQQKADAKTIAGKTKRASITATRDLSGVYFAPLGATAEEARVIQTLFPDAAFFTGAEAMESVLKKISAPRILHIATHGFFLQDFKSIADVNSQTASRSSNAETKIENPLLRSGLALAGANRRASEGDDGILTALEASGLNLWGTKLVVLSACDTGIGEVKNGEGVYGLRRAFVLAGAESLVMSMWSVSDYVTRELMANYYKNLKQGMGRGESLRLVQLEMLKRKDRQHPFYWAGFIQSGEWANLDDNR